MKNVAVLASGTALAQVLTLLAYPILMRLFNPEDFGLFALFGLVSGVIGGLVFHALREAAGTERTGTWRDALPVVALVVLLACPVLAVVAAKKVADRRQVGLDAATVATPW